MAALPDQPRILEINTWAWLSDLRATLATVPEAAWDGIAGLGVDAVWLMGVWERSPAGRDIARREQWLLDYGRAHLPQFDPEEDIVGSPYCVRRYVPDARLAGWHGLDAARGALADRGVALMLDFVPNHVAPDHPWVAAHPEFFVHDPKTGSIALGRDPYFPPWTDVLQLNAFHPGLREAAAATLSTIAGHCDAVRCDMAMLVTNDVFERAWGPEAGPRPTDEYWPAVMAGAPGLGYIAEAYWDLEWALMQQGFHYCYDKRLYDRLVAGEAQGVRDHLGAGVDYQRRLVRFIENHDEPRAASAFGQGALQAAAVVSSTLPGAVLYHQGQLEGRRLHVPVVLARRPPEPPEPALEAFYRRLIAVCGDVRRGDWRLCDVVGWPDNRSCRHTVAWCWSSAAALTVVAVNLSDSPAEGRLLLPSGVGLPDSVAFTDAFTGVRYDRRGADLGADGLYVALSGHGFHVLTATRPATPPG